MRSWRSRAGWRTSSRSSPAGPARARRSERMALLNRVGVAAFLSLATACASARATARTGNAPIASPPGAVAPRGSVHLDVVHSDALGMDKRVAVYLPASYGRDPARRYPVVFYLHGLF